MKFSYQAREEIDRSSFEPNKKRGSFLDRFKGRITQIGKEGHLSVVNSTKMPIKPSHVQHNKSYNYEDYAPYDNISTAKKTNYNALSPGKRSNTLQRKFERNGLTDIGNTIMRYNEVKSLTNSRQQDRVTSSHSLSPDSHVAYQSNLNFRSSFQSPSSSMFFIYELTTLRFISN